MPKDSILFHALTALTLATLVLGMSAAAFVWLAGSRQRPWRLPAAAGRALLGGARLATVLDVALQRRLFRIDRVRWALHMALTWSFLELFLLGSLGLMFADWGLYRLSSDERWFAATNDSAGLVLLVAAAVSLARSYRGGAGAAVRYRLALAALGAMAATGFLTEAARLLDDSVGRGAAAYAFTGFTLSRVLAPLDAPWHQVWLGSWWAHAVAGLTLVATVPFGNLFHMLTAPALLLARSAAVASRRSRRSGSAARGWPEPGAQAPTLTAALTPADLFALDACTRCGQCSTVCEAGAAAPDVRLAAPLCRIRHLRRVARGERGLRPLNLLLGRRPPTEEDARLFSDGLYRCTLCSRCTEACPAGIDLTGLWVRARESIAAAGACPAKFGMALDAVDAEHNVLGYPNVERAGWVDYMADAPADGFRKERATVLYYVGCMTSFSPAAQGIAESFARVMMAAGVDFALLGEDEWCCGFPLRVAGFGDRAQALVEHNVAQVRRLGAKTVVFNCPSCFLNWRHEYGADLPDVRMLHATQFIDELAAEGRLALGEVPLAVTYHDPCDLGRNARVFDAPRRAIAAVPGIQLREAAASRESALCCGGGGDLEITDAELASRIADRTCGALSETGAQAVVTACPECFRQLQSGMTRGPGLPVIDVCQLVDRSLQAVASARAEETGAAR